MNIRRVLRLSWLSVAALFWASCGDDSNPQTPVPEPESSTDAAGTSSSSGNETVSSAREDSSSSSEAVPESSATVASSSSARKYILASDSSVTCEKEKATYSTCTKPESYSCMELQKFLEKDTSVTAKILEKWEEQLESCGAILEPVTVYGVFYDPCSGAPTYTKIEMKCSNGFYYSDYKTDGDLVYKTVEEYNQAHGISSSSVAQSSSSVAEDLKKNCPQDDFVLFSGILADVQKKLYEALIGEDALTILGISDSISDAGKAYIDSLIDRENKTLKGRLAPYILGDFDSEDDYELSFHSDYWFTGYVAKTKTCDDGTPETTERYTRLFSDILEECAQLIRKNALAAK